jgi:UDP-galactopyranose mutase
VFFVEEPEPLTEFGASPSVDVLQRGASLQLLVPRVSPHASESEKRSALSRMLAEQLDRLEIRDYVAWYYTPMALDFTRDLRPLATVYDCMDELSAFHGAPAQVVDRERELFERADLIFTGGQSLYEAKRRQHASVHLFPSSVEKEHFARARMAQPDPPDQADIPGPLLGFFGVLDERLDIGLLTAVADARPDWHLVLVGPIAKIDPSSLPSRSNIHYLGPKKYAELPAYLAGWDVALLPFARNDATRFISPTKTPEYLAAGRPVVSTSIRDVIEPYATQGLVRIADEPGEFIQAVEDAMADDRRAHLARCDRFLSHMSWDRTWSAMDSLVQKVVAGRVGADSRVPATVSA